MISTVLFDLDGTLLDSVPLIMSGYRHVMNRHLGTVPPDDLFLRGIGTPLLVQLGEFARDEDELQAMLVDFRTYFAEHHDSLMAIFPGAVEVVREVHDRGIPLGLVTSKQRPSTTTGLEMMGVLDCFGVLVCADDVTRPKPDAEPVLQALQALDADPASAVFIGDSTHDLAAGRAAGVRTAAALWGSTARERLAPYEPTWWLNSPMEVLGLLEL
jgi:pyrophosphatase PpaX